jgi:YD repeat-containing protein
VTYNNASGNLDSYTDQNGNTTSYVYDAQHNLLQINAPNGAMPIRNTYNSSGRLTSSEDANGNTINYSYCQQAFRIDPLSGVRLTHPAYVFVGDRYWFYLLLLAPPGHTTFCRSRAAPWSIYPFR